MFDLIIIGAGVTGASISRRLARYKLDILVLEKEIDVSMGASKANSAIVHGGYAEPNTELRGVLCYEGRKEFKKLNEELNFGFLENGSLVLAFDDEDLSVLDKLYAMGIENGLDDLKIIGQKELRKIEPKVSDEAVGALYCEGAGVCSPYEYVIALMENALANKVILKLSSEVVSIKKDEDSFTVTTDKNDTFKSKFVINASGVEGARVSKLITDTYFDIHPRSGEYLLMQKGTGSRLNHVLFQTPSPKSKGILVTRTYHNNLLLGPDAIDSSEIDLATHEERLIEIYKQALKSVNDEVIDLREFIRSFAGLRPVSSTGDFIIEESKTKNFINVVGIQSPGLTSSPAIAKKVENILKEAGLDLIEDENYNAYRKPIIEYKDLEDFNKLKDKVDLSLGHDQRLVCRCEQVREDTIRDAMNRGIPTKTFDSIKRRTRTGMGFCQGAFCRNRVIEVMEDESGEKIRSNKFDIEHSGISRINKKDVNKLIKKLEDDA